MTAEGERITVIVFYGDHAASAPERLVSGACAAAARDMVDLALACPLVERVVVATNTASFAAGVDGQERVVVEMDPPGQRFHFGNALWRVIEEHGIRKPLYFGAGAAPLLRDATLEAICQRLLGSTRTVVTNNRASADFYGFSPPDALKRIPLPENQDNNLPYLLARPGVGLTADVLEPAIENSLDIDTPTDVACLAVQSALKPHLRAFLETQQVDTGRLEAAMPLLLREQTQVTLIGRVNTQLWGARPSDIPGSKRIFAEERMMKSFGRDAPGKAKSLLGDLYQAIGPARFFARLAEYSDVVFFDTRVLFFHLGLDLSPADRFSVDLGDVSGIGDPVAREFTAAALECDVPVILGAHNIVSGGLWALVQEAWDRSDAGLLPPLVS